MALESRVKRIKSYICKDQHSIHIIHLAYASQRAGDSPTIYTYIDAHIAHILRTPQNDSANSTCHLIFVSPSFIWEQPPPPSPSPPTITTFLIRTMKEKVWHTILYAYRYRFSCMCVCGITYLGGVLYALAFHIVLSLIFMSHSTFDWSLRAPSDQILDAVNSIC